MEEKKRKLEEVPRREKWDKVEHNPEFDFIGTFRKVPHNVKSKRKIKFNPPRGYQDTWLFMRNIGDKTLYITTHKKKFYIGDKTDSLPLDSPTEIIIMQFLSDEERTMDKVELYRQVGQLQDRIKLLKEYLLLRRWDDLRKVYKERGVNSSQENNS